jgi:NAD(P)-dependent dehydrogenase (short-subunit alcohol dehydrogenase family)
MAELSGTAALVTGAASERGIGRAIAVALAQNGANVAITDIGQRSLVAGAESADWSGLPAVVAEIIDLGREAVAIEADLGQADQVEQLVESVYARFGRIDIVVNNAAARQEAASVGGWEVTVDDWQAQLAINLTAPFLVSRAAIPHMLPARSGRIVNIASVAAKRPVPRRPGYNASKHGLIGLTRSLAADLAPHGITVNAICPGIMATDRAHARDQPAERRNRLGQVVSREELARAEVPAGRVGMPADLTALTVFLCGPESAYITGQAINVDGGMYMA